MEKVKAYYEIRDAKERDEHVERYGLSYSDYESVNAPKLRGAKIVAQVQD